MTIKISELPDNLAGVAGTDEFHVNKALVSEKKSAAEVATYVHSTAGALTALNPVVSTTQFAGYSGGAAKSILATVIRDYMAIPPSETLTTASTIVNPVGRTSLNAVGGVITVSLANGANIGQEKIIIMNDATFSATVSVTAHQTSAPEIFTFGAVGEYVILKWMGNPSGGWITIDATATV